MLGKERLDLLAVNTELLLECAQAFAQGYGQLALGAGYGCRTFELVGTSENGQPFFHRLRPPESVGMKECLPPAAACLYQRLRGRKLHHKVPGGRAGPVSKCFPSGGIILHQGLLELVDQKCALFNERNLVPAEQPQLAGELIHGVKRLPALAIDAQRVSQRPSVELIGLGAAGRLALAVAGGGGGVDRINHALPLEQLIHCGSLAGLDGDRNIAEGCGFLTEDFPALARMLELEVGDDLPLRVDDDHLMVIACPVKASVMSYFVPRFHCLSFLDVHRGLATSHPDTRSLAGYSSLRLRDRSRRTTRCTLVSLREARME